MRRVLLLKNSRGELIVRSVMPLRQVFLVNFTHTLKDSSDLSSFEIEWSLCEKKQKICQHFNFSLKGMPDVRSTNKPQNILKQLTGVYDIKGPIHEFMVRLGRPFRSNKQRLCIVMDIPD